MPNAIVLFSGGIDSYAAYLWAKNKHLTYKVTPMYINYKGDACTKEIITAETLVPVPELKIIKDVFNFSGKEEGSLNFLYARNLYFAIYASQYAEVVYLGGTKNSIMLDDTKEFYEKASVICSQVKGSTVFVTSPFSNLEKSEIVDSLFTLFGDSIGEKIAKTSSCYHPTKQFCWSCWNCWYFLSAIWDHRDKIPLDIDFHNKEIIKQAYQKAVNGEMLPKRASSTISMYNEFN